LEGREESMGGVVEGRAGVERDTAGKESAVSG